MSDRDGTDQPTPTKPELVEPAWFDRPQGERLEWLTARGVNQEEAEHLDKAMSVAFFHGSLDAYCEERAARRALPTHPLLRAAYDAGARGFGNAADYRFTRAIVLAALVVFALLLIVWFG